MSRARPATAYCAAQPQTLHWTVSLYIDAGRLFPDAANGPVDPLPCADAAIPPRPPLFTQRFAPDLIRAMQMRDPVSRAMRDAVEPLFNDIADREWLGNTQDFVLAADTLPPGDDDDEKASSWARATLDVEIRPPEEIAWTTEGKRFVVALDGLSASRPATLRRFWFVHNNGALSYHLSFAIGYAHTAADYYLLSLLQKLTAPKEFSLARDVLERAIACGAAPASPLDDAPLGIAPLDALTMTDGGKSLRFWPFVSDRFGEDFTALLARLNAAGMTAEAPPEPADALAALVDLTPIPEVPGLSLPKCRTLLFFHDKGFFHRLIPPPDTKGVPVSRQAMVRADCYAPYAARLRDAINAAAGDVRLDDGRAGAFWRWVRERPDDPFCSHASDAEIAALRDGSFVGEDGARLHIPAFERGRADCLDYLFLSGFNQNIIDFMNQDTSEILDSLDPIYPANQEQQAEGFFVRYANHRAMITYAPHSRSLEVGNDYIGTCPYAFLIHVLSMHNEFLARAHENESVRAIDQLYAAMRGREAMCDYPAIEAAINTIKTASFHRYERHAHVNVFRYDTERDVFRELEQLRGIQRKQASLERAVTTLEDLARDLEGRQHRRDAEEETQRQLQLNAVLFALGLFGVVQFLFTLADYAKSNPVLLGMGGEPGRIVAIIFGALGCLASAAAALLTFRVVVPRLRAIYALLLGNARDTH